MSFNFFNTKYLISNQSVLSALLIVCFFAMAGCYESSSEEQSEGESQVIPAVEAVKARYGSLPERLSGTVTAENQVMLSPEMSGPVERVYVQDGDQVQQGDPLVKLQDGQYREQYQQAKADGGQHYQSTAKAGPYAIRST